ncbi:MAG: hypothetical protein Kow0047_04610 [Anaerolineae bacterium]
MTVAARRKSLQRVEMDVTSAPHVGLWLDKFLPEQSEQGGENLYAPHFEQATKIPAPQAYTKYFQRWEEALRSVGAHTRIAETLGRIAVGLGANSVLENAIALHRVYGVPYIPGSALKGLAAHYADTRLQDTRWRKGQPAHQTLFGDSSAAGYVTFFDALYVPDSAPANKPLVMDVVTVHHPEYYRGENAPPADWDSPNPVPFVSARGQFLIALSGPQEWVDAAFTILELALNEEGIGAKTSSGYGRMQFVGGGATSAPSASSASHDEAVIQRFRERLSTMRNAEVAGQIHGVYSEWKSLEDVSEQARVEIAQAILDKIEEAGRAKKVANKPWYKELLGFVQSHGGPSKR